MITIKTRKTFSGNYVVEVYLLGFLVKTSVIYTKYN